MPALRGLTLAATPGAFVNQRTAASSGEVVVRCPLGGTWRTVRPEGRPAWSAGEAHRIGHRKGSLTPGSCELLDRPAEDGGDLRD